MLLKQFAEHHSDIVCCQEVRKFRNRTSLRYGYHAVFSKPASRNALGCAIYIRADKVLARSISQPRKNVHVKSEQIFEVYDTPRILVVSVASRALNALVVAAHVPHRGHGAAAVEE